MRRRRRQALEDARRHLDVAETLLDDRAGLRSGSPHADVGGFEQRLAIVDRHHRDLDRSAALHRLLPQRHADDRHDRRPARPRRRGPSIANDRTNATGRRRARPWAPRWPRAPAPSSSCGTGGLPRAAACKRRSRTRSAARAFCLTSVTARSASAGASLPATHSSRSRSWSADRTVASRPRFARTASMTWSTASGSSLPSGARAFMARPYHLTKRRTRPAWRYAPSGKNSGARWRTRAR